MREEEECPAVERDLREEGGPSRERALWQQLFLPLSLESAGSPEEEEEGMEVRVEGPSRDKGKGRAPVSEEARGEVTGVMCNLRDKKGIPCRWGKVSDLSILWLFIDLPLQKTAHNRAYLGCQQAQAKCHIGSPRPAPRKQTREEESPEEGPSRQVWVRHPRDARGEGVADMGPLLQDIRSAPPEQTWIMRQMWATHTAVELELRLLRCSAEYTFDCVF